MAIMEICETFRNTAIETWFRLSDAKDVKLSLGEETITDINLLEIAKARHPEIKIEKFNKIEEGENGADWEFWLTGKSTKWLGLRIQAKVINLKNDKYEQLHYKTKNSDQTEKLINSSMKNNLIPLYCLYTMCDLSRYKDKFAYKHFIDRHESFGCSIVDAFAVKKLGEKTHISHLIQDMIPWHCIFLVHEFDNEDLPHRALCVIKRIMQLMIEHTEADVNEYIKNFNLSDAPPDYIINFAKGKCPDTGFKAPDNDLAGIVIINEEATKHV